MFSIVTDQVIQQCTEFIDKVRKVRFNKVRDRQVDRFTRLLNRNSFNVSSENNNRVSSNNNEAQSNLDSNLDNSSNSNNNNNLMQVSNSSNARSKWVDNLSSTPLPQPKYLFCPEDQILPLPLLTLPMWSSFQQSRQHTKGVQIRRSRNLGWKLTSY